MFKWEKDGIRFMKDASVYTSYNRRLAEEISFYVTKESRICDAGCGLGFLSLALAPFVKEVVSVERDLNALAVLQEACQNNGIGTIRPVCGDVMQLAEEECFDAMVFCFFGETNEILSMAKKHCRGTVIAIKKNYSRHRFSVGEHACLHDGYEQAKKRLSELEIPFEGRELELEFGQPFGSLEDAGRFFALYSQDPEKEGITDEFLKEKLLETGDKTFPYYMPHRRRLGMLIFQAEDINLAKNG